MPVGQYGYHISANLIGHVTIGSHSVSPYNHRVELSPLHEISDHIVGQQSDWDLILLEFPGREPSPLKIGPRLIHKDVHLLTHLFHGPDDSQGRPITSRSQCPCIARGQDARTIFQQFSTQLA